MKNHPEQLLFGPSGCLSREGLALFAKGKLSAQEHSAVKEHLQSCEFCMLATEGMTMANPDDFEQDLEAIYASLQEVNLTVSEGELIQELAEGFEGPRFPRLSEVEMQQFRDNLLKKAIENQELNKHPVIKKPFFKRYRLEMIAAVILLLLALGARQLFLGFSPGKEPLELAQAPVEAIGADKMDVIQKEITESESFEEEKVAIKPVPPKSVQKPEVLVDREVSDDFAIVEDDSKVSLAQEQAGKEADATGESNAVEIQDMPVVVQNQATTPYAPKASKTEVNEATVNVEEMKRMPAKLANNATEESEIAESIEHEEIESEIFVIVERSPEFPGGETKKNKFLRENINYPMEAREAGLQGTVYITFVVERDGKISDIRLLRGIGAGCDEEALRVIRLMPKWNPGTQKGKPVRVQMNLPIVFSLR